jgi:hypothetical protein
MSTRGVLRGSIGVLGSTHVAAARAWLRSVPSAELVRALAAGVNWTSRTAKAGWAGRNGHTSVVDAAGAIYVIGGTRSGDTYYADVWASTDGGARPDSVRGVVGGYSRGYSQGYYKVFRGTKAVLVGY